MATLNKSPPQALIRIFQAVTQSVAAGEACVRLRSSREIVNAVFQKDQMLRFYDCYAAERRLRQLLQKSDQVANK
jgi:hypothetical protein